MTETQFKPQAISTAVRDWLKSHYDTLYAALVHTHLSRQVIPMHGLSGTVAAGATMYLVPSMPGLSNLAAVPWPIAGTFKNLNVRFNTQQPATGSLVATLQKTVVDTAVVVTVPAGTLGGQTLTSGTASVTFAPGDLLCIAIKNNATTASTVLIGCSVEFQALTV